MDTKGSIESHLLLRKKKTNPRNYMQELNRYSL